VGALFVVLDLPASGRLANVLKTGEEMLIQDFFAERPVETFDVGVLVGLA
jgi:hypothetical protein